MDDIRVTQRMKGPPIYIVSGGTGASAELLVRTVLAQFHDVDVPLIINKNDMQGMKSATTYAKRIGLESLTGIAPEDDDGNAAAKAPPRAEPPKPITADQFKEMNDLIFDTGADEAKFCAFWKVSSLEEMTSKQAVDAISMLKKKQAKSEASNGTAE